MLYPSYRWAVGSNNAAGLVSVEATVPAGDIAFDPPRAIGTYEVGSQHERLNGLLFFSGYESLNWTFNTLTRAQLGYLRATFCGGGWSGLVTVSTRTVGSTFANYNAVMQLARPTAEQNKLLLSGEGLSFTDYVVSLRHMVAL